MQLFVILILLLLNSQCVDMFVFGRAKMSNLAYTRVAGASNSLDKSYGIVSNGNEHIINFDVAGKLMTLESGKIGRQASGSVFAKMMNNSVVYTSVCFDRQSKPSTDFCPLRVDWFARYSAVGQTVGAFHRKDSRGDDSEVLVSRLVDRSIRPMILPGWSHETQVLTHVLSYDKTHPLEALSICASSAALALSGVPILKPFAAVAVGCINGSFVVNPTKDQLSCPNTTLSLVLAGTKDDILMIEGSAEFLPEKDLVQALAAGHTAIGQICDAIQAFAAVAGRAKKSDGVVVPPAGLVDAIDERFGDDFSEALSVWNKQERGAAVAAVEDRVTRAFPPVPPPATGTDGTGNGNDDNNDDNGFANVSPSDVKKATKQLLSRRLYRNVLNTGRRADGRGVTEVRPITAEVGLLPCAHGSALFTRGETQALCTATLGSKSMEARFETLDEVGSKPFYLQYRFPPASVGEVGRFGGVNRREVGHGNLAERALLPALPDPASFPYSLRAEALITESCGSSSMATVCGCTLACLEAGVPLKAIVAGVAMGLLMDNDGNGKGNGKGSGDPVVLTDLLGLEDALGAMDFKVAGSKDGISSFQLDVKVPGLSLALLSDALEQARVARLHVLDKMTATLASPCAVKDSVPRILSFSVPVSAIGKVIGPSGAVIRGLTESHAVNSIDIADDGTITVASPDGRRAESCRDAILAIVAAAASASSSFGSSGSSRRPDKTSGFLRVNKNNTSTSGSVAKGPPPEVGRVYRGCAIKTVMPYGVFVEVTPGHEGLVHVSQLDDKRIEDISQDGRFKEGGLIDVKVMPDSSGRGDKMNLSRKVVLIADKVEQQEPILQNHIIQKISPE